MTSRCPANPGRLWAAALALACGLAALPAVAQSDPPPVELDRKRASKLLVTQVKPDYPPVARINFIHGQVRMQVSVSSSGHVSDAHVIYGHPFLAASALEAIRRWVYRPFITRAGPTRFQTLVDVNFSLRVSKIEHLPPQPERDMTRQIHPPEVATTPADPTSTGRVRLRVLVSDAGEALDATPLGGVASAFDAARRKIERWTFRPARWGNVVVPWYLEIDVPVEERPAQPRPTPSASEAAVTSVVDPNLHPQITQMTQKRRD